MSRSHPHILGKLFLELPPRGTRRDIIVFPVETFRVSMTNNWRWGRSLRPDLRTTQRSHRNDSFSHPCLTRSACARIKLSITAGPIIKFPLPPLGNLEFCDAGTYFSLSWRLCAITHCCVAQWIAELRLVLRTTSIYKPSRNDRRTESTCGPAALA
jgi:hypothetical protein